DPAPGTLAKLAGNRSQALLRDRAGRRVDAHSAALAVVETSTSPDTIFPPRPVVSGPGLESNLRPASGEGEPGFVDLLQFREGLFRQGTHLDRRQRLLEMAELRHADHDAVDVRIGEREADRGLGVGTVALAEALP